MRWNLGYFGQQLFLRRQLVQVSGLLLPFDCLLSLLLIFGIKVLIKSHFGALERLENLQFRIGFDVIVVWQQALLKVDVSIAHKVVLLLIILETGFRVFQAQLFEALRQPSRRCVFSIKFLSIRVGNHEYITFVLFSTVIKIACVCLSRLYNWIIGHLSICASFFLWRAFLAFLVIWLWIIEFHWYLLQNLVYGFSLSF